MGHSEVVFGPVGCCVAGTRPHGPGNQGGPVGTCWARCLRARLGGARSPASPARFFARAWRHCRRHSRTTPSSVGNTPARWGQAAQMLPPRPHTWGTGFASRVGVGTGVDHARRGDCWVVRHTQRPALRLVLKPIPPLRTGCWSSNGTRCPLDSLGLATNARGGPLAVDFALPRPVVHQRLGAWGRPSADNE